MGAVTRTLIIFSALAFCCWCRHDGAPRSACSSLTPVHRGIPSQRDQSSYSVSAVKEGNKVLVTISSSVGEEFQGFVLQARSRKDKSLLADGKFTESRVAKAVDCSNGQKNTLTHKDPEAKQEVRTEWTPSSQNMYEEVVFRATVAKTYALFWTGIDSSPVRVQRGAGSPNVDRSGSETMNRNSNSMYRGCYSTVGCFGLSSDCIERTDCEVLLTYSKDSSGITFTLHGHLEPRVYMAMGLSTDNIMGDDYVTGCYNENSNVYARESYNDGQSNTRSRELPRSDYTGSFSNGLTTCSWHLPYEKQAFGRTYDLANNEYYALLAKGDVSDGGRFRYHNSRIASADAINFTVVRAVDSAGVTTSVKFHGSEEESTMSNSPKFSDSPMFHNNDASTDTKSTEYTTDESSKKTVTHDHTESNSLQLGFHHVFFLVLFQLMYFVSGSKLTGNIV